MVAPPRRIGFTLLVLAAVPGSPSPEAQWDGFIGEFIHGYFRLNPAFAVYQGRHGQDGRLPDWSPAGLAAQTKWLHAAQHQAAAFDTAALDAPRRLERAYLLAVVDRDLFWLERADWPHRNPSYYADALDPNVYLSRAYAPLADRLRAYTQWLRGVPAAAAQIRTNLRGPLPRVFVDIGRLRFGGMIPYLQSDAPAVFASVADTALQAALTTATAGAVNALRQLDVWLAAKQEHATDSFALGPELFRDMLWSTERVDVPLARLKQLGEADLERNLAALRTACGQYAPGRTLAACVERMRGHKPQGSPVAAARRQLDSLEAFVREHDLVTIPGTERARVEESPPYQRWNSAYIDIPGPYEHGLTSIYYIAPPDSSWTPQERADYIPGVADLLFTSVHEVWPGHFLQFLHSNRSAREFGRNFIGYAYAEGWAHYAEALMWEAGLGDGDPETHIGQLSNALLRDARFLSAIGLHTGDMTLAQSERLFRDRAFTDIATARQQARRGAFDPAYLNYTLGKLMILKLRADWTASRGGRAAWKAFHDELLSHGGPPIPLLRETMLGGAAGPAL